MYVTQQKGLITLQRDHSTWPLGNIHKYIISLPLSLPPFSLLILAASLAARLLMYTRARLYYTSIRFKKSLTRAGTDRKPYVQWQEFSLATQHNTQHNTRNGDVLCFWVWGFCNR